MAYILNQEQYLRNHNANKNVLEQLSFKVIKNCLIGALNHYEELRLNHIKKEDLPIFSLEWVNFIQNLADEADKNNEDIDKNIFFILLYNEINSYESHAEIKDFVLNNYIYIKNSKVYNLN
ncbi:MAG TPA: hypothetical protein PL131_09460 [Methylotenera sp.]|nr:hypothetical protein [Methylotenera sp.]HPH06089.1 hypothetical protein [Methylotenera sp.]